MQTGSKGRRLGFAAALVAIAAVSTARAVPPLPPQVQTPVLSYDGPGGFATMWKGQIVSVSRQGTRHWKDPTGRISLYSFTNNQMNWPPSTVRDTQYDDRNPAGGVTPTGALVYFYGRIDATGSGTWADMWEQRIDANGSVSNFQVPVGDDGSFSPYGPLVVLPSGRLMQTVYGWSSTGYRVRALFSNDDGVTWKESRFIENTHIEMPNETAATLIGGNTDQTASILAVTRSARWLGGVWTAYLMQSLSTDGGKTWKQLGWVGSEQARGVVPWIANIGGGRLALVTVIRDEQDMTINVSVARASDVATNPKAWPPAKPVYRSKLATTNQLRFDQYGQAKNFGDFGYPSIVQPGPRDDQKFIVFTDSHSGDSGLEPYDLPSDTDLYMVPLFAPAIPA